MASKNILRFWAILLAASLGLAFPVWGQGNAGSSSSQSTVQKKKKTIKSSAAQPRKKTSKKKKSTPKKVTPATKSTPSSEMYQAIARPLAAAEGPIQNVVEQEIQYLKARRQLRSGDEISIQVFDLAEKKMLVDINGDTVRNAASLIKPFVMLAVYEQIARQEMPETPEVNRQIHRMISISDNQATNRLIRQLGDGDVHQGLVAVNTVARKYGFNHTTAIELIPEGGRTYANRTSTCDTTHFFTQLYEQRLISPQYSQKMNEVLLKNVHERIKTYQLKKDGVAVADKTGYVRGLNGDCGIVYRSTQNSQGHDYVLSIIIENRERPAEGWGRQKTAVIRYLSDRIYQNLKGCSPKGYVKKIEEGRGKREAKAAPDNA
jgi:beta-lactamase class A